MTILKLLLFLLFSLARVMMLALQVGIEVQELAECGYRRRIAGAGSACEPTGGPALGSAASLGLLRVAARVQKTRAVKLHRPDVLGRG